MSIKMRHRRKLSAIMSFMLVVAMLVGSFYFLPATVKAADQPETIKIDFEASEGYSLNNLLVGQNTWKSTFPTNTKGTISSGQALIGDNYFNLIDNGTTAQNYYYDLTTPITQGKIEWWAKADGASALLFKIYSGSTVAQCIGFYSNNQFIYNFVTSTNKNVPDVKYEVGKWYKFSVAFNNDGGNATINVTDADGKVLFEIPNNPSMGTVSSINRIRIETTSATDSNFSIDGIRFRYSLNESPELTKISLAKNDYLIPVGQTEELQIMSNYYDGSKSVLTEGNQYSSSNPSVVDFVYGGQFRAKAEGNAVITVTNGLLSTTANVSVYSDAPKLTGISLANNAYNLNVGQTGDIQVIGSFSNNSTEIVTVGNTYIPSNPSVVEFVYGGQFKAIASGSTNITVSNGVYSSTANVNVFEIGSVPPYKNITPRTLQRETDLNQLTIITPPEADWKKAGDDIAAKLKAKWNINASVVASDATQIGDGWSGNTIVLGNLGNNPHIARLYGLYLVYTDAIHPGIGGYQLQTIIDPFGKGGNTILLGASDLTGLNEGVTVLNGKLDNLEQVILPWQAESKLSEAAAASLPYGKSPTDADVQLMMDEANGIIAKIDLTSIDELDAVNLIALFNKVSHYGKLYNLSNDDGYGKVYYRYWKAFADYMNKSSNDGTPQVHNVNYSDGSTRTYVMSNAQKQLFSQKNMWQYGYPLIAGYSVMEASPLFNEIDRQQIVSAIYLAYEANRNDSYLSSKPEPAARYNHDVFPALSIMFGSSYFMKYYDYNNISDMQLMKEWYDRGVEMFTENTSNVNLDEGSDYLMHVPGVTLEYAMATGDTRFLALGLRPSADLNAMMIDNLGTMSGGGDVYPFGYSSAYSWSHSQVMNAASWFFGDPMYQYLLERTKTGPFNGQNMPDLSFPFHRYVTDKAKATEITGEYPMVQAYPVEQGVYDQLKGTGTLDVAIEDTFHKMTFREGYDLDDAYLMVDGFGAGKHGHLDGNTIIKYSANGRIFIDDRDYIEKSPKNHTGIVIVKDGVQEDKPPLAKLEWAADAGGVGVSKSTVPNYNGTDWTRSIISPNGDFFLIYDDVQVNQDGKYILENTWQTLGDLNINGNRYGVSQAGVTMNIQSLDESDLRQYERYGHFIKYWESVYPYPYADEEHVLREVKEEKEYKTGDVTQFINVLSSTTGNTPAVNATRINNKTIQIQEGSDEWYATWGTINTANFESNGKFHLVGGNEILAAETTSVRIGTQTITFAEPVIFKLNTTNGSWEAYKATKGLTSYDANGNPVNNVTFESGTLTLDADLVLGLINAINVQGDIAAWQKPAPSEINNDEWVSKIEFGEEVTSSFVSDVNGDGKDDLVLGGINGKVQVLDYYGLPLWKFQSKGRVNEVSVDTINGEAFVFVATENWFAQVLDKNGIEKWSVEFPSDYAHAEQKGNMIGVTNIRVAYINGQDPWIMVGTQFRYIYGYDLQGNKVFEDIAYYYGIEDMEFLDLDKDGKDEGFIALEYYYGSVLDEGKLLLTRYGSSTKGPGPGYKALEAVESWSGSDMPAVFFGTKQNKVHLAQWTKTIEPYLAETWRQNVGGEVNDTIVGDFDKDGRTDFLAVSDGFQVYSLKDDGSVNWKATLNDRVMKIADVQTPEGVRYVVAADNGKVYVLDTLGAIKASYTFDGLIQDVYAGAIDDVALVVLDNGLVYEKSVSGLTELPTERTAIVYAIIAAQVKYDAAVVGTNPGQYVQSVKDTLNAAITAARAIYFDANATAEEQAAAVTALNAAVVKFEASAIKEESADPIIPPVVPPVTPIDLPDDKDKVVDYIKEAIQKAGTVNVDSSSVVVNGTSIAVELGSASIAKAIENLGKVETDLAKALNEAGINIKMEKVLTINVPEADNASGVGVKLPVSAFDLAKENEVSSINLDTGVAQIALQPDMLKNKIGTDAKMVEITSAVINKTTLSTEAAQKVGDNVVYDFNILVDGEKISKFNGNKAVSITLDYQLKPGEDPNKVVVYYINDKGELEVVKNSKYDVKTGTVTFTTNHFSNYVVKHSDVRFKDVAADDWSKSYVEALAVRGVISGIGEGAFEPERSITRVEFTKIIMYAFDLVDETAETNFTDIKVNAWYYKAVASAQKLKIVEGTGNNQFGADELISRQDMATIAYRAAELAGVKLEIKNPEQKLTDESSIASYAKDSVKEMKNAGIINGRGNGKFAPEESATRAEASKIIYLLFKSL